MTIVEKNVQKNDTQNLQEKQKRQARFVNVLFFVIYVNPKKKEMSLESNFCRI